MKAIEKLKKFAQDYAIENGVYQNYSDDYIHAENCNDPAYFFVGYYGDYLVSEFGFAYCAIVPKSFFSYRELKTIEKELNIKLL